jgi:excisionase family DNA binding protein
MDLHAGGEAASFLSLLSRIADCLVRIEGQLLNPSPLPSEYLSIKEASALSAISRTKLYREIRAGRLPASNVGSSRHPHYRIARADLAQWLEKQKGGDRSPPEVPIHRRKIKSRFFGEI